MLIPLAGLLLILWFLGVIGAYAIGWLVHVLLIAAVVMFIVRIVRDRNPLS